MIRLLLMIVALLSPAALGCTTHDCSNDNLPFPILGDEIIEWDPVPDEDLAYYEVWTDRLCLTILAPASSVRVAGTSCITNNDTAVLQVRACDTGGLCGNFSNPVEILPFTCVDGRESVTLGPAPRDTFNPNCEALCYPDAPFRLPEERRCL